MTCLLLAIALVALVAIILKGRKHTKFLGRQTPPTRPSHSLSHDDINNQTSPPLPHAVFPADTSSPYYESIDTTRSSVTETAPYKAIELDDKYQGPTNPMAMDTKFDTVDELDDNYQGPTKIPVVTETSLTQ